MSGRSVRFEDEAEAAAAAAGQYGEDEPFDMSRVPPAQRALHYALVGLDWISWGLTKSWVPIVALIGLTPIYVSAKQYPYQHIVDASQGRPQ